MSSVIKPVVSQLIGDSAAANADELGDTLALQADGPDIGIETVIESTTGGWDAYEVWRRFIKDARDRRKLQDQT